MYLKGTKLVTEEDIDTFITTEDTDEEIFSDEIEVKEVHYEKKYSQDEVCEDAKKEVFDMTKNQSDFYEHLDSGGFF